MRDDSRENPEVISHLNSENDYLEAWFLDGKDNRDELFEEITNRIPKKEDSVPIRLKSYEYFRRYEPDNEHPIYIRRKDKNSEEIILIDVNELAKGKDFSNLPIGVFRPMKISWLMLKILMAEGSTLLDLKIFHQYHF